MPVHCLSMCFFYENSKPTLINTCFNKIKHKSSFKTVQYQSIHVIQRSLCQKHFQTNSKRKNVEVSLRSWLWQWEALRKGSHLKLYHLISTFSNSLSIQLIRVQPNNLSLLHSDYKTKWNICPASKELNNMKVQFGVLYILYLIFISNLISSNPHTSPRK